MGFLNFVLTGNYDNKPKEIGKEAACEAKKPEPEKNEMDFSGDLSPEAFKKLVDGGQDGTGRYKNFLHSQYGKKLEEKLEEIVEARKKEGRTFSKDYARQLANKLSNESDAASKELAKVIRGEK